MHLEQRPARLLDAKRETLSFRIIATDGGIILRPASAGSCPGHGHWPSPEPRPRPVQGFSIVAQEGKVLEIHRASVVNPEEQEGLLSAEALEELKKVLPVVDGVIVYGH